MNFRCSGVGGCNCGGPKYQLFISAVGPSNSCLRARFALSCIGVGQGPGPREYSKKCDPTFVVFIFIFPETVSMMLVVIQVSLMFHSSFMARDVS